MAQSRGVRFKSTTLDARLVEFATTKVTLDTYEQMKKDQQADLVQEFKDGGFKSHSVAADGMKVTGTLVEPERVKIDEERLKKAVGTEVWNRITSRTLDKKKLEALLALGEIDPNVVASCSETSVSPYIKIAMKETDANPDLP